MDITLGFLVILTLVVLPGLIFRRLYYYGEFSKQFSANHSLFNLLAISCVPGLINLLLILWGYDLFITEIDFGAIIDKFKQINDPNFVFSKSEVHNPVKLTPPFRFVLTPPFRRFDPLQ